MADILKFPQPEKKPRIDHEVILVDALKNFLDRKARYLEREKIKILAKNVYLYSAEKYSKTAYVECGEGFRLEIRAVKNDSRN